MTLIKDASFLIAAFITTLGALAGTHAMFSQLADWRARFAVIISGLGLAAVLLVIVAAVAGWIRGRRAQMPAPAAIEQERTFVGQ
jgi:hypothetical protein